MRPRELEVLELALNQGLRSGIRRAFKHVDEPPPPWLALPTRPEGANWAPPFLPTSPLIWRHDSIGDLPDGSFHRRILGPRTLNRRQPGLLQGCPPDETLNSKGHRRIGRL